MILENECKQVERGRLKTALSLINGKQTDYPISTGRLKKCFQTACAVDGGLWGGRNPRLEKFMSIGGMVMWLFL